MLFRKDPMLLFVFKLFGYFIIWTLYSYTVHVLAHSNFKSLGFLKYIHIRHHAYDYGDDRLPPWYEYFFWFGNWRSSMDVYLTFTLPLIGLLFFDPLYGAILFGFHYFYEIFLARNVLDHNPNITGKITKFFSIGTFHLAHHRHFKCNYGFFFTFWDHLFGTNESDVTNKRAGSRIGL